MNVGRMKKSSDQFKLESQSQLKIEKQLKNRSKRA